MNSERPLTRPLRTVIDTLRRLARHGLLPRDLATLPLAVTTTVGELDLEPHERSVIGRALFAATTGPIAGETLLDLARRVADRTRDERTPLDELVRPMRRRDSATTAA